MRILVSVLFAAFALTSPFSHSQIPIPRNAEPSPYGYGWVCITGYKRVKNKCEKMTPKEAEQQILILEVLKEMARKGDGKFTVGDETFTLPEITRKCQTYRWSKYRGDIECSGSKFRPIEKKCEAYFRDAKDEVAELRCKDAQLAPLERYCTVAMYSKPYGDITCTKGDW